MDHFQYHVEQDLRSFKETIKRNLTKPNLNKVQTSALQELKHMDDFIFKMADNSGTDVALNKDDYYCYIITMLQDVSMYTKLTNDSTEKFQIHLSRLLDEGVSLGAISPGQVDYLSIKDPVIPIIHALPKIHKKLDPPPMRPIISEIGAFV